MSKHILCFVFLACSTSLALRLNTEPVPVTFEERSNATECSFEKEKGQPADCQIEAPEHYLVRKYIGPTSTVLELGARYGTTTCEIAMRQLNSGRLVSVDPDYRVWDAFRKNTMNHQCQNHLIQGVVGQQERRIQRGRTYGTRSVGVSKSMEGEAITFEDIQKRFKLIFDTMLIDCEGCINIFFDENPGALDGIQTILLEADSGKYNGYKDPTAKHPIDYDVVLNELKEKGFEIVEAFKEGEDGKGDCEPNCIPWMHHFALQRTKSKL